MARIKEPRSGDPRFEEHGEVTKQCNYRCNLCHDFIEHPPQGPTGFGVYFTYDKDWLNLKPFRDIENHICLRCLKALVGAYQEVIETA